MADAATNIEDSKELIAVTSGNRRTHRGHFRTYEELIMKKGILDGHNFYAGFFFSNLDTLDRTPCFALSSFFSFSQ